MIDNFELLNDLVARKRKALVALGLKDATAQHCLSCYQCGCADAIQEIENREIERKVKSVGSLQEAVGSEAR